MNRGDWLYNWNTKDTTGGFLGNTGNGLSARQYVVSDVLFGDVSCTGWPGFGTVMSGT